MIDSQLTDKSFSNRPRPTSVRESDKSLFNLVVSIFWQMLAVNGEGFDPISQLIAIYQLLSSNLRKIFKFFFRIQLCGRWRSALSVFLDWQENWFGWLDSGREGSPDTGVGKWKKTSSQLVIINHTQ